jgi:hypothetical protein
VSGAVLTETTDPVDVSAESAFRPAAMHKQNNVIPMSSPPDTANSTQLADSETLGAICSRAGHTLTPRMLDLGAFFRLGGGLGLDVEVLAAHEDAEQRERNVIAQRHRHSIADNLDVDGIKRSAVALR